MESAIQTVRQNNVTDKFQIVKILMERAEQLSNDGPTKKHMVIEAYSKIVADNSARNGTLGVIPMSTIEMIVDAFIFATKSAMDFNKRTNCWSTFTALFKPKAGV